MENLNLVKKVTFSAPNPSYDFTTNLNTSALIVVGGGLIHNYHTSSLKAAPTPLALDNYHSECISIQHLPEMDAVCCILNNGKIIQYDLTSNIPQKFYIPNFDGPSSHGGLSSMSSVSNSSLLLSAAEWSPDQTILAVIDKNVTYCHLLTKDFENICSINLQTDKDGRDANVNVGWGSRSTQFQGKAGKSNREKELDTEYTASSLDNQDIKICWRPDGQYLAISYYSEGNRVIRTFTRDGTYLAKSEPLPGLTSVLAWSNSLQYITTVQVKTSPPGIFVVFLEKNGLRHGTPVKIADLDSEESQNLVVTDVLWSQTNLLAVSIYDTATNQSKIEIYQRYVYEKWYKKFSDGNLSGKISKIIFDPDDIFTLHVLLDSNNFVKFSFSPAINQHQRKLMVADGAKIMITDFKDMNLPPPMFQKNLDLSADIAQQSLQENSVIDMPTSLSMNKFNNSQVAAIIGNAIYVYDFSRNPTNFGDQPAGEAMYRLNIEAEYTPLQVYFCQDNLIILHCNRTVDLENDYDGYDGSGHAILKYDFRDLSQRFQNLDVRGAGDAMGNASQKLDHIQPSIYWSHTWHPLMALAMNESSPVVQTINSILFAIKDPICQNLDDSEGHLNDGSSYLNNTDRLSSVTSENEASNVRSIAPFGEPIKHMLCLDEATVAVLHPDLQYSIVCLTKNQNLYLVNHYRDVYTGNLSTRTCKLAYNVTSFMIHKLSFDSQTTRPHQPSTSTSDVYLLATLNSHELIVINLDENFVNSISGGSQVQDYIRIRIENDSVLLASYDTEVVLFVPRGETKTIRPRPLLIAKLRHYLKNLNFKAAFRLARDNCLDFNLLVDDNFSRFAKNAELFLHQVGFDNEKDGFHIFIAKINNADARLPDNYKQIYNHYKSNLAFQLEKGNLDPHNSNNFASYSAASHSLRNCTAPDTFEPIPDNKQNLICDLFQKLAENLENNLSVFTACCIRKNPREVRTALLKIKDELDSSDEARKNLAEKAIRQIFIIVDDKHKLYREALGTYDKNIFLIIANRANQDPTEVNELLDRLANCQPESFRKANIDIYLNRYEMALENLAQAGHELALTEALKIARSEKNFPLLVHFCDQYNSDWKTGDRQKFASQMGFYKTVCSEYATDLTVRGQLREAAIYLQYAEKYFEAAKHWEKVGEWERALNAYKLSSEEVNLPDVLLRMAQVKENQENYADAAVLYNFNSNYQHWDSKMYEVTLRACKKNSVKWCKIDLYYSNFHTQIRAEVQDFLQSECLNLNEQLKILTEKAERFVQVVLERFQEISRNGGALIDESLIDGSNPNAADNLSIDSASVSNLSSSLNSKTSSMSSKKRTGKTAKARRKAAKKKYNNKPGSRSEHLGLLTDIKKIYESIESNLKNMPDLIFTAKIYNLNKNVIDDCKLVCKNMIRNCNALTYKIWPHYATDAKGAAGEGDFDYSDNSDNISQTLVGRARHFNKLINLNDELGDPDDFDGSNEVYSRYKLLRTCIETGIEVKRLEENYQREFSHRVGGLFLDLKHDLKLVTPSFIDMDYNLFD